MNQNPKALKVINTFDEQALISEFQCSPRVAKRIISMRPYSSLEALDFVWGMEETTKQAILSYTGEISEVWLQNPPIESEPNSVKEGDHNPTLEATTGKDKPSKTKPSWKTLLLLVVILSLGAVFRFSGLNWDDGFHQHPDERYMTMVADQIRGVSSINEYFNTYASSLNPLNFGSYTYGMLPLFLTRMIAVWVNMATYDSITLVGRFLSGVFDLAAVLVLYLLADRLYNKKVALLAAAFAAAAVLPIQLSHFFTVDSFATVFVLASFYFLYLAIPLDQPQGKVTSANYWYFVFFGICAGMAGACKVNTLPVLGMVFVASLVYLFINRKQGLWVIVKPVLIGLFLAGFSAFVTFRIFQPYAFTGPFFYDVKINANWYEVIKEVTGQVAGNSEWPPNHHWTKRPSQYAWVNMVLWGMGLPLGLAAWFGFGWAGMQIWKGNWRKHLLPFIWVLGYFLWQNMQFWRYMRYFLPVYPFLILFAAWAIIKLLSKTKPEIKNILSIGKNFSQQIQQFKMNWRGFVSLLFLLVVLGGTYGYAFAFTRIYARDHTRVQASRWILANIPGPLNVILDTEKNSTSIPIPVFNDHVLTHNSPQIMELKLPANGTISTITTPQIKRLGSTLWFKITWDEAGQDLLTEGRLSTIGQNQDGALTISLNETTLEPNQPYFLHYQIESGNIIQFSELRLVDSRDTNRLAEIKHIINNEENGNQAGSLSFTVPGVLNINQLEILDYAQILREETVRLKVSILQDRNEETPLVQTEQTMRFTDTDGVTSAEFHFPAVNVDKENNYQVKYELIEGNQIRLLAENFTLETSWDDALPLSVDGIDALGGIYTPFNLELYEPDSVEKREKMIEILDASEYIIIPSNRAYDAMPRLELRYPLTLRYYQLLFDCQCSGDAMEKRAYQLEPPFQSPLGFDLVATFTSHPTLGWIQINDQNADESFTVYDHPKVFVFKKSEDFSIQFIRDQFLTVDLDAVIFQKPIEYSRAPTALRLPEDRLIAQLNGGTWSDMFNRLSLFNESPVVGVIFWYLFLLLLGLTVFPSVSRVFSGLPDMGYPLMRMAGLIVLTWLPWLLGSLKLLPFTRLTILLCLGILLLINGYLFYQRKQDLLAFIKRNWRYLVFIEGLFLGLFLFSLTIRINNPDVWHPWLGGEKPMEFAFFNAVLKAVYFPPANPWFSGHYINYYYYGYAVAAIPTKILGIIPATAFNLVIPSWFAMTGTGVFAIGYNLYSVAKKHQEQPTSPLKERSTKPLSIKSFAVICGLLALMSILFFGNFFEVKLLWKHLPEVANLSVLDTATSQFSKVLSGARQVLSGNATLPGDNGRWYFSASRPILHFGPDTPIAEFPYFSFLYADLHPHLLTMPFFALGFGWCLSTILDPLQRRRRLDQLLSLIFAGLFIGSMIASHTWDVPLFVGLGSLAVFWNLSQETEKSWPERIKTTLLYILIFVAFTYLFYKPFTTWFNTAYTSIELWKGVRTPLSDYFTVFGLSLFIMFTNLVVTLQSDLKLVQDWFNRQSNKNTISVIGLLIAAGAAIITLWIFDYQVLAFGFPLILLWLYLLFWKKGLSILQRLSWFLFAIGYGITFFAEIFVLKGDVGRANMVFRIYIEAWFLLGFAISLTLVELFQTLRRWKMWLKIPWLLMLVILIFGALSYALIATRFKIKDRWPNVENPPKTLDGSLFMLGDSLNDPNQPGAIYVDEDRELDLSLDYYAIKFLQGQINGTPIIVEGHTTEYRWGARYAIHTGLPTVIGWNWHTRQHNSLLEGSVVEDRIVDVNEFYNTIDLEFARTFLKRYRVNLIIVSGLERAYYSPEGLEKFSEMVKSGELSIIYGDEMGGTATIYQVIKTN